MKLWYWLRIDLKEEQSRAEWVYFVTGCVANEHATNDNKYRLLTAVLFI